VGSEPINLAGLCEEEKRRSKEESFEGRGLLTSAVANKLLSRGSPCGSVETRAAGSHKSEWVARGSLWLGRGKKNTDEQRRGRANPYGGT